MTEPDPQVLTPDQVRELIRQHAGTEAAEMTRRVNDWIKRGWGVVVYEAQDPGRYAQYQFGSYGSPDTDAGREPPLVAIDIRDRRLVLTGICPPQDRPLQKGSHP